MTPSIAQIQRTVAEFYGLRLQDMTSPRRAPSVSRPRMTAMHLARELTGASFPRIGMAFGKHHTTVIHAVSVTAERIATDGAFAQEVKRITASLKGTLPPKEAEREGA